MLKRLLPFYRQTEHRIEFKLMRHNADSLILVGKPDVFLTVGHGNWIQLRIMNDSRCMCANIHSFIIFS